MLDNVVVEAGDHPVIICKGGIQWIMQRRKKMRSGDVWVSTSYHVTRMSLLRLWTASCGRDGASVIEGLPENFTHCSI